ncbi:MAG: hypothetical protein ACRDD2_09280 [Sarcina sp.]
MEKKDSKPVEAGIVDSSYTINRLTNLNTTEKLNENIIKYKVPIGRSGPIIGIFPIIISDFQIDINCEIKYKPPIQSIKTLKNNVKITNLKFFNDSHKLFIEGYLSKTVDIISENTKTQNTNINIPFKTLTDVKYCTYPKFDLENDIPNKKGFEVKKVFTNSDYLKISWKIESINLFEKMISEKEEIIYKIIVSLNIILTQNQKVFIPEPLGDYYDSSSTSTSTFNNLDNLNS